MQRGPLPDRARSGNRLREQKDAAGSGTGAHSCQQQPRVIRVRACKSTRDHGTNPATAVIAGYQVENIKSESHGQIDVDKLRDLVTEEVAALMITNPSTLGIFEERIPEIAEILHAKGALLYMDGANMNALTGVTRPGDLGVDVMHLNLHKTFSTPHGGGGPGAGPVAMKKILEPFRPVPILVENDGGQLALETVRPSSIGKVRAFGGNFGVLVRALAYILAYGPGVRQATEDAVLNANYIRKHLEGVFDLPYGLPSMLLRRPFSRGDHTDTGHRQLRRYRNPLFWLEVLTPSINCRRNKPSAEALSAKCCGSPSLRVFNELALTIALRASNST